MKPTTVQPGERPGEWRIAWTVSNDGGRPLSVEAVWEPHGRFRWDEQQLDPAPELAPGASTELTLPVRCVVEPGEVVENGFVILRVRVGGQAWRVLTRLTVVGDDSGAPRPRVEAMTSQRVGFSEERGG